MFKTKLKAKEITDSYKVRLVTRGFSQLEGINFKETYVVKSTTIRVYLSIVVNPK